MKRRVGMDEGVKWFLLDPLVLSALNPSVLSIVRVWITGHGF